MLANIYKEFIRLRRDWQYFYTFLDKADVIAAVASIIMMLSVFMPWVRGEKDMFFARDFHMVLAIFTLLEVRRVFLCHVQAVQKNHGHALLFSRLRRISFHYFLIGAASMIIAVALLIQFTSLHTAMDIRFGFYVTILSGFSIFLCGLERFRQKNRLE